jgi:uroporphyrinogen-III decarboxylase
MKSRERLLLALDRQVPDRVPVSTYELVGHNSLAWANCDPSYARLMQVIRDKTDCVCMWTPRYNWTFLGSSYPVEIEVEEWQEDTDTIKRQIIHTPRGDLTQTTKLVEGIHTGWRTEYPCKTLDDVSKALAVPFQPLEYDYSDYPRIKAEVGDEGIIMADYRDAICLVAGLMEFGELTIWARTERAHFARTVAQMHERNMANLRNMLRDQVVDLYRIYGPEYATPPFLPPDDFRDFVAPYLTEMIDLIHSRGAKARIHCHGRVAQVLDLILGTGADALDPCEAPPSGDTTLSELKRRAGEKLCLFGNIQPNVLECGTRDDVERVVWECMASAKDGGGYVIMPTSGPISYPLTQQVEDNYLAYIDAALRYGQY